MQLGREKPANRRLRLLSLSVVLLGLLVWTASCGASAESDVVQKPKVVEQPKPQEKKTEITLEQLEKMFANMRSKSNWNVDGELLWGYFFTDPDPKKLELLVEALTRSGYRFGSIYETDDKHTHFLHVEKVEKHTPQTLHERNTELYRLAEEYGLEYDGMDVGPVSAN